MILIEVQLFKKDNNSCILHVINRVFKILHSNEIRKRNVYILTRIYASFEAWKERTNEEIIRTFQEIKKVREVFTELQSLIRFIQMRVRARKKGSKFVVFETEKERAAKNNTQKIMKKPFLRIITYD